MLRVAKFGLFIFVFFVSVILISSFAQAYDVNNPFVTNLMAGQHYDVGDVLVWNDANYLYVKYQTVFGWYMSTTHLHIASSMEEIPQKNGNPIPGRFNYKEDHNPMVNVYTKRIPISDLPNIKTLYIAAHADVCVANGYIPANVNLEVLNFGTPYYFNVEIEGLGVYPAFCVDTHRLIFDGLGSILGVYYPYTATVSSSYSPSANTLVNYPDNLDIVNWILNQDFLNKGYTAGDLQVAIWYLLDNKNIIDDLKNRVRTDEYIGEWDETRVWFIINSAISHDGYIPQPGDFMVFIINPYLLDYDAQNFIIVIRTGCETAWGAGPAFSGANWAMYFTYDVEGTVTPANTNNTKKGKK